jgi:hypothetical protein
MGELANGQIGESANRQMGKNLQIGKWAGCISDLGQPPRKSNKD